MNEEAFVMFLEHFTHYTNCSIDHPVLLILDDHKSHISLKAVKTTKGNGVIMFTLPPHTSQSLQPLDKTVYGPLKTIEPWMVGCVQTLIKLQQSMTFQDL